MARIKLSARIHAPDRCTCDAGQLCAIEIAYRTKTIEDEFTSIDRRALPFALERIQSLIQQLSGGAQNVDSDLAVIMRAAKHTLHETIINNEESSSITAEASSSSSSLLPVSTPAERSHARLTSMIAYGEHTGCGSAQDRALLEEYHQKRSPVKKWIGLELQSTDELNDEDFDNAKNRLVTMQHFYPTQTVPHLQSVLTELFGEPPQYSIIHAAFQLTRHLAIKEQQQQEAKEVQRRLEYEVNRAKINREASSASRKKGTKVNKSFEANEEEPLAKRLRSTTKA